MTSLLSNDRFYPAETVDQQMNRKNFERLITIRDYRVSTKIRHPQREASCKLLPVQGKESVETGHLITLKVERSVIEELQADSDSTDRSPGIFPPDWDLVTSAMSLNVPTSVLVEVAGRMWLSHSGAGLCRGLLSSERRVKLQTSAATACSQSFA